ARIAVRMEQRALFDRVRQRSARNALSARPRGPDGRNADGRCPVLQYRHGADFPGRYVIDGHRPAGAVAQGKCRPAQATFADSRDRGRDRGRAHGGGLGRLLDRPRGRRARIFRRFGAGHGLPARDSPAPGGNRRHYGGMVVHFGIVIVALGLVGSGLFRHEASVVMAPGDALPIAGETLRFEGVRTDRRFNYRTVEARFTLLGSGRVITPERRVYPQQGAPMTETGIDSTPLRDVYLVLGEPVEG